MVNHWWFITPNIIYQRLPYDSRLVHLVPSLVHLRSTGELRNRRRRPRGFGARLGGAIVEGSARHDNHPAISVGDFMGFSQKHPAIKGYPHLWKSLYIYIIESQYGLGRLSRQNWIMESLCFFSGIWKSLCQFFFIPNIHSFEVGHTRQKLQLAHIATLPQTAGVWFKGPVQLESWQKAKWNSTSQNHKPASR